MKTRIFRLTAVAAAAFVLAGCASLNIEQAVQETNQAVPTFTQGKLELSRTDEQRQSRQRLSEQLLATPLGVDEAVQLALANSPAMQALIAQSWADLAAANQFGRIANPVFTFERVRLGSELEIGRLLSFGLLDLITLPQRQVISRSQTAQAKTQLSAAVVDQVSQVRQGWVRAVAAQQQLTYAQQVNKSAEAGAELARRLQQVGNFTRLQRARQQAFYADAVAQLAAANHAATAAREELVRLLGLDAGQAAQLKLPERLPDLPKQARATVDVTAAATQQRLDVQLARQQLEVAGRAQGLNLVNSLFDTEAGVRRDTVFDGDERANASGFELAIRLPLFDWGGAQRAAMNAQSLAAANRYEAVARSASSQLRESYSAYRTAYDVARHYRDEIVPLRKTISDENVLRYNGMFIGVFELLADTREQVTSVMQAINAQQQFWLADAGLASSLIGKPLAVGATAVSAGAPAGGAEAGH
ncbi:TolC family protein [Ramlibacter sp. AW1]|uniref:TolC family protein n=1 Tax=Ramlibacter aurantiacus TaxID=2801330 RepID=A0A936ZU26_9BURK|nr:TolC family protein [Ramlibacter aurantiacus]MBL0422561.1 TolC family protein [Ramlibacter aurantiacus]